MKVLLRFMIGAAVAALVCVAIKVIYLKVSSDTVDRFGTVIDYPMCDDRKCRVRVKWPDGLQTTERVYVRQLPVLGDAIRKRCPVGEARSWLGCETDVIN